MKINYCDVLVIGGGLVRFMSCCCCHKKGLNTIVLS